jgi:hypothetical protein
LVEISSIEKWPFALSPLLFQFFVTKKLMIISEKLAKLIEFTLEKTKFSQIFLVK